MANKTAILKIAGLTLVILIVFTILANITNPKTSKNGDAETNYIQGPQASSHLNFEDSRPLCEILPINEIDRIIGSTHQNLKSDSVDKNHKSCVITYDNQTEVIFEYNADISIDRHKKIAQVIDNGYKQDSSIPVENVCKLNSKGQIKAISLKTGEQSSISIRVYKDKKPDTPKLIEIAKLIAQDIK